MGWILLVVFVAVAVVLYARGQRPGSSPEKAQKSLAWRVGVAIAIWVGVMALGMATFIVGALLFDDEQVGLSGPEGAAIDYVAYRDSPIADRAWQALHPNLRAQTSRQDYLDCFFSDAQQSPAPDEDPEVGRQVPSDNVLVQGTSTYSVAERRDDTGIVSIDVRVERPSGTQVVTVLLYPNPGQGWVIVGMTPADPCLLGSERLRGRLQATGQITIELQEVPDLDGYRVLAGVSPTTAATTGVPPRCRFGDTSEGVTDRHPISTGPASKSLISDSWMSVSIGLPSKSSHFSSAAPTPPFSAPRG